MGLSIYPKGDTNTEATKAISAYLEVRPGEHWLDGWTIPQVQFAIEVKNIDSGKVVSRSTTHDFSTSIRSSGWSEIVRCNGYEELKQHGWISAGDAVCFSIKVAGASLGYSKTRPENLDRLSQMWRDMRFADMRICGEEGCEDCPCHRACLATASPVFDTMLSSGMREGVEQRLVLRNASTSTVRFLLEYVYTGSLPAAALSDLQGLGELLQLADQYDVQGLLALCATSAVNIATPANILDLVKLLGAHRNHAKVNTCLLQVKKIAKTDDATFDELWQNLLPSSQ